MIARIGLTLVTALVVAGLYWTFSARRNFTTAGLIAACGALCALAVFR